MIKRKSWAIHPGEILKEEFLSPLGLSAYRLALDLHVPPIRINEIVNEKRSISVDTALRLAKFFGNTPQFWLNLQTRYDLQTTRDELEKDLSEIKAYQENHNKTITHS